jgi:hypothetical protein
VTLKIPRPLHDKLSILVEGSGFSSVTQFVVHVLGELVSHQDGELPVGLSARKVEAIRQRLKKLGYL